MRRLLGLFLCLMLVFPAATPVDARVNINISIGSNVSNGRSITCQEGRNRLRHHGFRDIRTVDCRGRFFVYRATRDGRRFEIALNRHNGRVVDMRRTGR
ncbi:hypothetical protein [Rhizobium sp. SL42]|uniref:hypothetical protein n=1 Tax=Rhizobium sp. SL42 TaxID=2806346 RepID=UPI001F39C471|nr:hypothetical protein [Rhizobium sp. SL42]UJW75070.1 hypothetical protein IM739_00665 [Rhizobium sp. SL42]